MQLCKEDRMNQSYTACDFDVIWNSILNSKNVTTCKKPPLTNIGKNEPYVVVCYSQEDYRAVYLDLMELYEQGVRYWYDYGLPACKERDLEIARQISSPNCTGVLFYLSPNAFERSVLSEIKLTLKTAKEYCVLRQDGKSTPALFICRSSKDPRPLTPKERDAFFLAFPDTTLSLKHSSHPQAQEHLSDLLKLIDQRFHAIDPSGNRHLQSTAAKEVWSDDIPDDEAEGLKTLIESAEELSFAKTAEQVLSADDLFLLAEYYRGICDFKTAADYFKQAAEKGHREAQYQIARHYHCKLGSMPHDDQLALDWYRKAAAQGHRFAKEYANTLQKQVAILPKNEGTLTGEELFQKGNYFKNLCDFKNAARLHLKAAEKGHVESQFLTAQNYHKGLSGFSADPKTALSWYQKAAQNGHSRAKEEIESLSAQCNAISKPESAMTTQELFEKGNYHKGLCDFKTAAGLYLKAANQGHAEAQFFTAQNYHKGLSGFAVDPQAALNWYRKAAAQGHRRASDEAKRLGNYLTILSKPESTLTPDELYEKGLYYKEIAQFKEAAKWHLKAAQKGHREAQYLTAQNYHKGMGGFAADPQVALDWYQKAAAQGHSTAGKEAQMLRQVLSLSSGNP